MSKVSVIIPSYNHEAYITEAVKSVLNQTYQDLELIIVDDGSSDNSLEVLERFSDPRMVVVSQVNQGAHAAINRGLRQARGDFLAILNSDDAYHPQRLENILQAFKSRPSAGLIGSYIEIMDSQGNSLGVKHGYLDCPPWLLEHPERSFRAGDDLHAALLTENFWSTTSNFVFSRAIYEQTGDFLPLRYAHDWDFALRTAHRAPSMLIPKPLIRYRVHTSNTIRENQVAMIFEICWILAVHLPQNVTSLGLFGSDTSVLRLEQLLHSIYVFGMERVLSVMLLQRLDANADLASRLLDPNNPMRYRYIAYIAQQLANEGETNPMEKSTSEPPQGQMTSKLKRAALHLRSLIGSYRK